MKVVPFLSVLALVTGAFAADSEPVYIVSTDVDARLDDCTVSVTEGGVTTEKAFSAVTPTVGTFKKRGLGTLTGSTRMSAFTGDLLIEEGAYLVNEKGMTGPYDTTATAGGLVVSNGASLILAHATKRSAYIYNNITISGSGAAGRPGAIVDRCTADQNDFTFYGDWSLADDATIYIDKNAGIIDWTKVRSGSDYLYFYLHGHDLTIKGAQTSRQAYFSGIRVVPEETGDIILDCVTFQGRYGGTWYGDSRNRLILRNGGGLEYYNSSFVCPNWTLVADGTARISARNFSSDLATTNGASAFWNGPAGLSGMLTIDYDYKGGYAFNGPIEGLGGLLMRNGWLKLTGAKNTGTGAISVSSVKREAGLIAHTSESINPKGSGLFLTNAPLVLVGRDRMPYDLPMLSVDVPANSNVCVSSIETTGYFEVPGSYDTATKIGGLDAVAAGFRKTGPGTYRILPAIAVTGVTEIVEGTVKLEPVSAYSACPGLWEGITRSRSDYNDSRAIISNRVTSLPLLETKYGEPWWLAEQTVIYGGYIWNRTGTNVTWSFAGLLKSAFTVYIDGTRGPTRWDDANPFAVKTYTLTPGPHTFEYRSYYGGGSASTGIGGAITHKTQPGWKAGMGFALSETACMEGDATKFFVPSNNPASCSGGDGIWFTRDNRWPNEFTAEEYAATRASFDHLVLHAGATLDIANATNFVKTLRGVGTVRNGGLAVKESWTLRYSDIAAGSGLVVDDALVFGDGASIAFDGEGVKLKRKDLPAHGFALATAENGIVGTPTVTCADDHWTFHCSADGKTLRAVYRPDGLMLIVR